MLGLISLAACNNENDLKDVYNKFDYQRQQYCSTLYDSRLIVIGLNKDGGNLDALLSNSKDNHHNSDQQDVDNSNVPSNVVITNEITFIDPLNANSVNGQTDIKPANTNGNESSLTEMLPKNATSTQIIFYPTVEDCLDLKAKIREFVEALFWVLESKRLDRSQERAEKLTMLTAPFEKKDYVGVDTDGR